MIDAFWSSVNLTGNQTGIPPEYRWMQFWSSVNLTGNQTDSKEDEL